MYAHIFLFQGLGARQCSEFSAPFLSASSSFHALFYLSLACSTQSGPCLSRSVHLLLISEFNPFLFLMYYCEFSWEFSCPGCNGLRCFWQHLKYGVLHFPQPFSFTENTVGASISSILLLSTVFKKKKMGKLSTKLLKVANTFPLQVFKDFFLSSLSYMVFLNAHIFFWIALNGLGNYCPMLILNYLFKLIFQLECFRDNSFFHLVHTQEKTS